MLKKVLKIMLFGFISWLIPFVSSFFFFSKEGLLIDKFLFKSIMILVGSASGAGLLIYYFKSVTKNFLREGIVIGLSWYFINILLDFMILLPMSGMSIRDYVMQIALVYSTIIAMSTAIGASLHTKNL